VNNMNMKVHEKIKNDFWFIIGKFALFAVVLAVFTMPAAAQNVTSDWIVRSAVEEALKKTGNPQIEIIAQGSWISGQNYKDPRFQQILAEASDHDMRVFIRAQNVSEAQALKMWKTFRMNVQKELQAFVNTGLITSDELQIIRKSVNIYPPEELMKGVQSTEKALARFGKWGIYPSLLDVGTEGAGGSYGGLLKFERQAFETGSRTRVFYLDRGEVRIGAADLNHALEGHGLRTPEGLAKAAEENLDNAIHGLKDKNLKDTRKYVERAVQRLKETKLKLKVKLSPNDEALIKLNDRLQSLWKRYEAAETRTSLLSDKILPKTPEDIRLQQSVLDEFEKLSGELERVLKESIDDSYLLQRLAKGIEEGKPIVSRLFRGLLDAADAKWSSAASNVRKGLGRLGEAAQKIGFLNALVAYWTIKDLPEIYVNKGAGEATARFSMSLASMAVPEIAIGELVAVIAVSIAEMSVDYVSSFGYKAVTSTQDCFDLIAGLYTVYGRETQVLGEGMKKCHNVDSIRQLSCDIYDINDLQGAMKRTQKIDSKLVPSALNSLILCHAENASRRYDIETKTDKGVEEALINKCTGPILTAWIEQREMILEEIKVLLSEIERSELRLAFNASSAVIKEGDKNATISVSAEFMPSIKQTVEQIKNKLQCIGGKTSKPFLYQNFIWKKDGVKAGSTTETTNYMEFSFSKKGKQTICVESEIEYGLINTPSTMPPSDSSGKIVKTSCVDVEITEEVKPEKIVAIITGPNKTKAPETGETDKEIPLAVDLKTKRDIKEFSFVWIFEGGYDSGGAMQNENMAVVRYPKPGTYEIKVEVYNRSDAWKVKEIKSVKLAEAKHKITIEPSLKDAKIELKISGNDKIVLGDTVNLSVEISADEKAKSKLKTPVWFVTRPRVIFAPDEGDPLSNKQWGKSIGQGANISYKPVVADEHVFSAEVFGEGVSGAVASASRRVSVSCKVLESFGAHQTTRCHLEGAEKDDKLSVMLMPDRTNVKSGEKININAVARGGSPPYTFKWVEKVEGEGPSVRFVPSRNNRTVTVEVKDAKNQIAKESINFNVDTVIVPLEGLKEKVVFGTTLDVRVPVEGDKLVLWQSSPNVTFKELEGKGGQTNTITFDRMDKVKVWADVRVRKGEVYETVASTEQFEVNVQPFDARIEFDPPVQKIGGNVNAQVKITQPVNASTVNFVWIDPPTSNREMVTDYWIKFKVPDEKPVPIEVELRSKRANETIVNLKRPFGPEGKTAVATTPAPDDTVKKTKRKDAVAGLEKAKSAVSQGRLDEGITLADESAKIDPTFTEAVEVSKKWKAEKDVVVKQAARAKELAEALRFAEAEKELAVAQKLHPKYRPVIDADTFLKERKAAHDKKVKDSNDKLANAKLDVRKGKLDEAILKSEEAVAIFPGNKDAAAYATKLKKDRETILLQIDKTKKLIADALFADAQKELIFAQNLNGMYKPVVDTAQILGDAWRKYDSDVRNRLYEVRSANERKDFDQAIDKAKKIRETMKLYGYNDEQLRHQENWAKQKKVQKDKQIGFLKSAGDKLRSYDYVGALKAFEEGFADSQNIFSGSEPEFKEAFRLRDDAYIKNKRLNELTPIITNAAENTDPYYGQVHVLANALKAVDEAIALQPNNEQFRKWREQIVAKADKKKAENERFATGRKYIDAAAGAERSYSINESYIQAKQLNWGEKLEEQQHKYLETAILNYVESLKYIPDAGVEKKIKELQKTLDDRRKFLENYKRYVVLRKEADVLASNAFKETDFNKSLSMHDQAVEKYKKSLSLYTPYDVETISKQIWNLEYSKHDRMVKKYWADGQSLEKVGRILDAIDAYDKAIASFHPTVSQKDRMWIIVHQQELRNRVAGAKNWRTDGEAKQKAGKIAEAVQSYKQSVKLLPDAALENHIKTLEGQLAAEAAKKSTADKLWKDALCKTLWSEGNKLQNSNRLADALVKYKEYQKNCPTNEMALHIQKIESKLKEMQENELKKTAALKLRQEGDLFVKQNKIADAISKYKQSLSYWHDSELESYIKMLETRLAAVTVVPPPKTGRSYTSRPSDVLTQPSIKDIHGEYSGTVTGDGAAGKINIVITTSNEVTGSSSGSIDGDPYYATFKGIFDTSTGTLQAAMQGSVTVKGSSSRYPFTGNIWGKYGMGVLSGQWKGVSNFGNPTGTWNAAMQKAGAFTR